MSLFLCIFAEDIDIYLEDSLYTESIQVWLSQEISNVYSRVHSTQPFITVVCIFQQEEK